MQKSQFLANANHIISIKVRDKSPTGYRFQWRPEEQVTKRQGFFRKKVTVTQPGMYACKYGYARSYFKLADAIKASSNPEYYQIEKTNEKGEGPDGQVFHRPQVTVTLVGGKYVAEEQVYFDTYAEIEDWLTGLHSDNPGKFTVIFDNDGTKD